MSVPTPILQYNLSDASVKGLLPSGYTPLAYIESSGTLYINTGWYTNSYPLKLETEIIWTAYSGEKDFFGNFGSDVSSSSNCFVCGVASNKTYQWGGSAFRSDTQPQIGEKIHFLFIYESASRTMVVNGVSKSTTVSAHTFLSHNSPIGVFSGAGNRNYCGVSAKMYYARIWSGNTLGVDLRPARRDSDGVIGMYDLVSRTFKTNAGSGTFIAGPELAVGKGGGKSLPEEYLLVEYLYNEDKTSWINFNRTLKSNTIMKVNMQVASYSTGAVYQQVMGYATNTTWKPYSLGIYNNAFILYSGTVDSTALPTSSFRQVIWTNSEETAETSGSTLGLFHMAGSPGNYANAGIKVQCCQILEGSSIIIKAFPCYRKSDGKPGMYDVVNGVFYTNAGSGEFILGPSVNAGYTSEPNSGKDLYEFYDYIQSDGNLWINTGVPSTVRINSTDAWYNLTLAKTFILFGCQSSNSDYTYVDYCESNGYKRCYYYGKGISSSSTFSTDLDYHTSTIRNSDNSYTATYNDANGGNVVVNTAATNPPSSSNYNFYLFAYNNVGTAGYKAKVKMKHFRFLTDSLSTSRDFWPCKRLSDGAVGMFDAINKVFYPNSGSGAFTVGNKTSKPFDVCPVNYINVSGAYDTTRGWSLHCPGNGSYLELPQMSSLITNGTIAVWYKLNTPSHRTLFVGNHEQSKYIGAWETNNRTLYHGSSGTITNYIDGIANSIVPNDSNWHFYVFTGVNFSAWSSQLLYLNHYGSSDNYNQNVQFLNLMVFDSALTAAQVKELYGG